MIWEPSTLTRSLVIKTGLVVGCVFAILAAMITVVSSHLLFRQIDRQVGSVLELQLKDGIRGGHRRPVVGTGMPPGTIIVAQARTQPDPDIIHVFAWQIVQGGWELLPQEVASQLFKTEFQGTQPKSEVTELGGYRLASATSNGRKTVVGLPLDALETTRRTLILAEILLGFVAVIASMVISGAVVTRSLRPLHTVTQAAKDVSELALDKGDVTLPMRVDVSDLPPGHEVAQVGNSFNHMLVNVESALAARQASETRVRRFVADASHELRNPLAAIRGYAELSKRDCDSFPEDTRHAIERIDSESARMSKLVNSLLLLARLDNEPIAPSRPVDLTEVVLNAVADARAASPEHVWALDLPDVPVVVRGDADRLHQVVVNLASNARTHTPPGTRVETTLTCDGSTVTLIVSDKGPGVSDHIKATMFERFARGDDARSHSLSQSTGLGLAIVDAVVKAQGGSVRCESEPGKTSFIVKLPAITPLTRDNAANPECIGEGPRDTS